MKPLINFLLACLVLLGPTTVNAAFSFGGCVGDGNLTGAYPNFTITGNSSSASRLYCYTTYTETFQSSGTMFFDWAYVSHDINDGDWLDTYFDPAGYVLNGVWHQLPYNVFDDSPLRRYLYTVSSGSTSVDIAAGDTFGWYVMSLDNCCGPAELTVWHARFVSEPGAVALLGVAFLSLVIGGRRWRRPT